MIRPDFWAQPDSVFTSKVLEDAGRHAAQQSPLESCGLVRAGRYVPCKNLAENPEREFMISAAEMQKAFLAGDLEGVIHSHPGGPWYPTKPDIESQIKTGVPWAIVIPGDETAELACHWGGYRPPVFDAATGEHIPRKYRHYVADCYALVEDLWRERFNVILPKVPRDIDWWDRGEKKVADHIEAAGFQVISTDQTSFASIAKPNDVFLSSIFSPNTPNHLGVFLGKGLMIDHRPKELSRVTGVQRYLSYATHWLRYVG